MPRSASKLKRKCRCSVAGGACSMRARPGPSTPGTSRRAMFGSSHPTSRTRWWGWQMAASTLQGAPARQIRKMRPNLFHRLSMHKVAIGFIEVKRCTTGTTRATSRMTPRPSLCRPGWLPCRPMSPPKCAPVQHASNICRQRKWKKCRISVFLLLSGLCCCRKC